MTKATCQSNVTEIGDWLRPYEPYGSKRQTFSSTFVRLVHFMGYRTMSSTTNYQTSNVHLIWRCGLSVMNWTCDRCLALIPTASSPSAAITLGKGFTVHFLVFSDGT